jgi:hypothetical protein
MDWPSLNLQRNAMTITKKRVLLIASLPLAAALVLGVLAMLPARPGATKANYDRIEIGMPKVEVERMFGRSAPRSLRPAPPC